MRNTTYRQVRRKRGLHKQTVLPNNIIRKVSHIFLLVLSILIPKISISQHKFIYYDRGTSWKFHIFVCGTQSFHKSNEHTHYQIRIDQTFNVLVNVFIVCECMLEMFFNTSQPTQVKTFCL